MSKPFLDTLLATSHGAHAAGQHEVAYHALCAATHAAQDARDAAGLRLIRAELVAQIGWLDAHAPEHPLSTESAAKHGHPGVYVMLARQVDANLSMIQRHDAQQGHAGTTAELLDRGDVA